MKYLFFIMIEPQFRQQFQQLDRGSTILWPQIFIETMSWKIVTEFQLSYFIWLIRGYWVFLG